MTYTDDGPSTGDANLAAIDDVTRHYSSTDTESDGDPAEFFTEYPVSAAAPVPRLEICRKFSVARGTQTKEQNARAMQVRWIYIQHKLQSERWVNKFNRKPTLLRMREERRSRRWKPTVHAMEFMWKE